MTIENETVRCDAEGCSASMATTAENVKLHQKATHQEILMVTEWDRGWTNVIDTKQFCPSHSAA